jgi:hypothetical protein
MTSLRRALAAFWVLLTFVASSSQAVSAASALSAPSIYAVEMSTHVVSAGQTIFGHVSTSDDVASVEARVQGFSALLSKRSAGDFALQYRLPSFIPGFLRGTYTVRVIARTTEGVQAVRELPVILQ